VETASLLLHRVSRMYLSDVDDTSCSTNNPQSACVSAISSVNVVRILIFGHQTIPTCLSVAS